MKKTNILFIHHGTGIGGSTISLVNLINYLDKNRYQTKVACLHNGKHIDLLKDAGIKTEVIDAPSFYFVHNESRRQKWYYLPYYLLVFICWIYVAFNFAPKYLKSQKFDIIHLNSHVLTSWAYAANKLKAKVIIHNREAITRGYIGIRYRILKKLIREKCDYIINISNDNKKRLGITNNSSVIYNFLEIPDTYRITMNDNRASKRILYLGGTSILKGFNTVYNCIDFLDKNIILEIAGNVSKNNSSTNAYSFLQKLLKVDSKKYEKIAALKRNNKVRILGALDNPYPAIDDCDILITPFKNPHFSRPAIEAFAFGKPVIGSDIEGMNEIIDHKKNGLLFENGNGKSLANAINYLCSKPKIAQKMGNKGRYKAEALFSPSRNTDKLVKIYEHVLNI